MTTVLLTIPKFEYCKDLLIFQVADTYLIIKIQR